MTTTVDELDSRSFATTYFDLPDLRLTRAGITVARRTRGEDTGWYATLPVGATHYPPTGSAQELPPELSALLLGYTAGATLRPCAHISVDRQRWRLVDGDETVLAEAVSDTVTGQDLRRSSTTVQTWQELDVRPRAGKPDRVRRAARRIADADGPALTEPARLNRILGPRPSEVARSATAAQVLTHYLGEQVAALRAADLAVRLDDPEGVHDLRVAVRRLRSCLRVFRPVFDPAAIRGLATELAWLSDVLGAARDTQVLREGISAPLRQLPGELVLGPVWTELDRLLAKPEADTIGAVRDALGGGRYRALLTALDRLLSGRPFGPRGKHKARKVLARRVRKAAGKVATAVRAASAADDDQRDVALHDVRKKAKRLRYACEAVEPVLGTPARTVRKRVKQIQQTLGAQHDSVELRATLRDLGARAQVDGGNGFTFGLLYGQLTQRGAAREREFAGQWQRLASATAFRSIAARHSR